MQQVAILKNGDKAILAIDYDLENRRVIGRPTIVAQYRNNQSLMPVWVWPRGQTPSTSFA